jgi:hypothetical protein
MLVRKGGFEPPRSCERQPLKLVRLPVPPLPQVTLTEAGDLANWRLELANPRTLQHANYFGCCAPVDPAGVVGGFAGVAGVDGAAGVGRGAGGTALPLMIEPGPR